MELLLLVDAAKQAGATKVRVVAPYMGYLRQDKVHQLGEAHGAALLVRLLRTAGADELLICDPHTKHLTPFFQGTHPQYRNKYIRLFSSTTYIRKISSLSKHGYSAFAC